MKYWPIAQKPRRATRRRRKRVPRVVVEDIGVQRGRAILNMGCASGEEALGSHLRVASSPDSVGKAGITRAKRPSGASRLIVWKMAYCLHLPNAPDTTAPCTTRVRAHTPLCSTPSCLMRRRHLNGLLSSFLVHPVI